MVTLLLAIQATAAALVPAGESVSADSAPRITLAEAIRRSSQLDPDYVRALGQIDDAAWGRRAAVIAFFVPSIDLGLNETKYSESFFNPADPANPTSTLVVGTARANYDIFSLRKFAELPRSKAELETAEAGELEQRFRTALETESAYYDVLVNQELGRVAEERVRRAGEGLNVARARVASGAAVQTDSLQLVLELTRARVEVLRQRNALGTARYELGRRVGGREQAQALRHAAEAVRPAEADSARHRPSLPIRSGETGAAVTPVQRRCGSGSGPAKPRAGPVRGCDCGGRLLAVKRRRAQVGIRDHTVPLLAARVLQAVVIGDQ